ncbi:hypothetical protein FRB98_000784 [Tulasnella sp. 332]|nr:hypothetical protein FRB98_000784 [Tulasnella sp. 332]
MSSSLFTASAAAVFGYSVYRALQIGKRDDDLPPGPPTKPLLGNILEFPRDNAHFQFTEWAKTYGEIFSLKIATGTVVILNSAQSVRDVMESKGNAALTADRPQSYVAEVLYRGLNVAFARYGESWRHSRQAVQEVMNPKARVKLLPIQMAESAQLMYDLVLDPSNHYAYVQRFSTSLSLCIVVGQRAPRPNSPLATELDRNTAVLNELFKVGGIPPVDLIPSLAHIPERWAAWKTKLFGLENRQKIYYSKLLKDTQARIEKGASGRADMLSIACEKQDELKLTEDAILNLGPALLDAASVVGGTLQNAFILFCANPHVQKKAQQELDAVVGTDRVPVLEDMARLPYIRAVIEEVHRMRPVGPLGVPHAASEDVMYKGYRIPKGTIIMHNTWAVFHSEELYDDPDTFNPDRWLATPLGTKKDLDPSIDLSKLKDMTFGAGRRQCPGRFLGMQAVDLVVSRLLWGFDILKRKDADGNVIEPNMFAFKPALENLPAPWRCDVRPRSARHAAVIRQEFIDSTPVFEDFERELEGEDKAWLARHAEQLTTLRPVARRWNHFLETFPTAWTEIDLTYPPQSTRKRLRLSVDCLLDVVTAPEPSLETLPSHIGLKSEHSLLRDTGRIRTLYIPEYITGSHCIEDFLRVLLQVLKPLVYCLGRF